MWQPQYIEYPPKQKNAHCYRHSSPKKISAILTFWSLVQGVAGNISIIGMLSPDFEHDVPLHKKAIAMARIARLINSGEPTVYHLMSRTALEGFPLVAVEKDFMVRTLKQGFVSNS